MIGKNLYRRKTHWKAKEKQMNTNHG